MDLMDVGVTNDGLVDDGWMEGSVGRSLVSWLLLSHCHYHCANGPSPFPTYPKDNKYVRRFASTDAMQIKAVAVAASKMRVRT